MAILTDKEFKRAIKRVINTPPSKIWRELYIIGQFLALVGAVDSALAVWQFAYGSRVIVPLKDTVFGDSAVSSMTYQLGFPDISGGRPLPSGLRPGLALAERVDLQDWITRRRIATHAWSPSIEIKQPHLGLLRRARALIHPTQENPHTKTEIEAIPLLREYLDDENVASNPSLASANLDAYLMVADVALRHGDNAEGMLRLQQWFDFFVKNPLKGSLDEAFGLKTVARTICNGIFSDKTKLPQNEYRDLVKNFLSDLGNRLSQTESPKQSARKFKLRILYNQFYLEPEQPGDEHVYFQDPRESTQGFSSFPYQAAVATPSETAWCEVEIEFRSETVNIKDAIQAVCFPLSVKETSKLFLRTVMGQDEYHFGITPGDYDVVAHFYKIEAPRPEAGLRAWRVVLSFLPRGTMKVGTLKLEHGQVPASALVHNQE